MTTSKTEHFAAPGQRVASAWDIGALGTVVQHFADSRQALVMWDGDCGMVTLCAYADIEPA